jgi:predicted NUDIX family NTP pyrophosphohydrolase
MYRSGKEGLEVFLAHPTRPTGGAEEPGEWTIPKGGQKKGETLLQAAQREFEEEVGIRPAGPYLDLGAAQQDNGKMVHIWAFQGDWDESKPIRSPLREIEWPPASGRFETHPEMDQACFFPVAEARQKVRPSQRPFLDRLEAALQPKSVPPPP